MRYLYFVHYGKVYSLEISPKALLFTTIHKTANDYTVVRYGVRQKQVNFLVLTSRIYLEKRVESRFVLISIQFNSGSNLIIYYTVLSCPPYTRIPYLLAIDQCFPTCGPRVCCSWVRAAKDFYSFLYFSDK